MALKNFTQFTPQTVLSATDYLVGYRDLDEIRTDLSSLTDAISGLLISKGFTPGGTVGSVKRVGFRFTIASGNNLNAVSGFDDFGSFLLYNAGAVEVYRNGSHLVENLDYQATNGTQVRNLSTLNVGDVVEVSSLSGIPVTSAPVISSGGQAFIASFRYTVNVGNTIVPNATLISGADDYSAVLNFIAPNLEVYLNGSRLTRDLDYGLYSSGSSFTLNDPVTGGDVLDIIALSGFNLTTTQGITAYSNVTRINRGKNILVSQTSGVVTISAKSDICSEISLDDVPVPGWTDGQHITRWSLLQDYLSAVATTNTSPGSANYTQQFGSFTGGAAFVGGVVAPNGYVYLVPAFVAKYYKINPIDNSVTSFGTTPWDGNQLGAFNGGVLAPNGRIYFIPAGTTMCYGVDPSNDTIFSFGSFTGNAIANNTSLYAEGVLAPNGRIYCFPYRSSICQVIDPSNNSVASFGTFVQSGNGVGGVLAPNGRIYMAIDNNTVAKIIDPSNNTVTAFATLSFNPGSSNGVIAPNGRIYMFGITSFGIVIDPQNNTITSFGTFAYTGVNIGSRGILLPNGFIYGFAHKNSLAHLIDPSNNSVTSFSVPHGGAGVASYHGGVQTLNGKLIYVPHAATSTIAVQFLNKNIFNSNFITNPLAKP